MRKSTYTAIKFTIVTVLTAGAIVGLILSMTTKTSMVELDPDLPVKGVDVSSHNGDIDFDTLRSQGIRFALIKATEGSTFKDPAFHANYRKARQSGLKTGAYHFFRFETPGHMQAINLLNSVRGRDLDFPLIIDVEEWGNPYIRPTVEITDELNAMISHLKSAGYPVMLYTNKDGHARFIQGRFDNIPLWICSFSAPPAETGWALWQYTHKGDLRGVRGKVDLNAFSGSDEDFETWVDSNRPPTQY